MNKLDVYVPVKDGQENIHGLVKRVKSYLSQRFKRRKIIPIKPAYESFPIGAGVIFNGKKYITHTNLSPDLSAIEPLVGWQKFLMATLLFLFLFGLFFNAQVTLTILLGFLTFLYFLDLFFSFFVISKSIGSPPEIKIREEDFKGLDEASLPVYSILCPLYKEAEILPHLVEAISKIDWPKEKLDVILLLEEDDKETQRALKTLTLAEYFRILIVPDSLPKTKPKACNFGLAHAKGEFLVVYDAEDRPDPLQLKKAYSAFLRQPEEVVCLQSKLNYYNPDQNLLTRLFTAEYSLWFDLILPGLQVLNTTIPLGGTSNHFKTTALRELAGWDPFNVTEDCDLGTRLFKQGYKTGILDSTTFEEANSKVKGWVRQRSRWIKGYIQTYLVHTRKPLEFLRRNGVHALIFQLVVGARTVFIIVNPVLWFQTLLYFGANSRVSGTIEAFYPAPIYYLAVFCLVFGNFMYLYNYMIGCAKRGYWNLIKYIFFVPFYWILASAAALISFYQLIRNPYFWEKTEHGLHLKTTQRESLVGKLLEFENSLGKFVLRPIHGLELAFFVVKKAILDIVGLFETIETFFPAKNGRLRILIFNWRDIRHDWAGGAEVYIHELAKRWVARGHKVTVFCGWDGKGERNEVVDGVVSIRRGGFYTVYLLAPLYYLLRLRNKYDVVIDCENGIPFFTPIFVEVPKLLLIHHVHQEVFRKHLRFPLASLAIFLEAKVMPALYKTQAVVTISNSSKNDIVNRGWIEASRIEVVNPGVDPKFSLRIPKSQEPSFVYLGRLKPWKNVNVALKAFAAISKKYPLARFTIAGFGESIYSLTKLAKKLGIAEKIWFAGKVTEAQKAVLFGQTWAAIQPSSFEGWGITVIEANSCGTPVIASDVNGLRDSVLEGRTGILFPEKDEQKLADAMERIIVDTRLRLYLSEEAYLWAKNFSWDHSANLFEQIIKDYVVRSEFAPAYELLEAARKNYQ